jgi:hypothetical protein
MWMNSLVGFRRSMSFVDAMWSLILFVWTVFHERVRWVWVCFV